MVAAKVNPSKEAGVYKYCGIYELPPSKIENGFCYVTKIPSGTYILQNCLKSQKFQMKIIWQQYGSSFPIGAHSLFERDFQKIIDCCKRFIV